MADELTRVFTTLSILEGEIARGRLESEGIPVMLKGEGLGPYRFGPVHVFVPAAFEVQARLVLDEINGAADARDPSRVASDGAYRLEN